MTVIKSVAIAAPDFRRVAPRYFAINNEPVLPDDEIRVERTLPLGEETVGSLCKLLVSAARSTSTFVIVCHGSSANGGTVRLYLGKPGPRAPVLDAPAVDGLQKRLAGSASAAQVAEALTVPVGVITSLTTALQQVRAMGLRRLEFRSCVFGENASFCEDLRMLFGVKSLSAPTKLTAWQLLDPKGTNPSPSFFERWVESHDGAAVEKFARGRVAWRSGEPVRDLIAESQHALRAWMRTKFVSCRYEFGILPLAALEEEGEPVFPRNARYRALLTLVPSPPRTGRQR